MTTPIIKAIHTKDYTIKQSKYETVGKLPLRDIVIGPSGVGKSHLIVSLILNVYRNCFERIYIYSPSIHVDEIWKPVKEYIKDHIQLEPDEDVYFDHYDPSSLQYIIDTQHKIRDYMQNKNYKKLFSNINRNR